MPRAATGKPKEEPQVPPTPTPEPQPDGVFIVKAVGEDGNIQVQAAPIGDVRITEVQTILELALKEFRNRVGFEN